MAYVVKNNTGSLFENRQKLKNTHPDLTGVVKIDGVDYRIAAWKTVSAKGVEYHSLAFTEIVSDTNKPSNGNTNKPSNGNINNDIDDDVPF